MSLFGEYQAYRDAHSRAVFKAFEDHLGPFMERVTPDWLLHHMEIRRNDRRMEGGREEVEIRLVLRPLGDVTLGDDRADLRTGPLRLTR